ncbi:MAG: radical SAM protein [bacterium]|nr:radical SAM protein [bacterium]
MRFLSNWLRPFSGAEPNYWEGYPESRLKDVILFLTDRCNMRCDHCMFWERIDDPGDEMTREQLGRLASTTPSLRTVAMTGGEPFLRNDVADIVENFFRDNQTHNVQVNTNGLLMERMRALVESDLAAKYQKFLSFQVSIDGLAETHDRVRRLPGSFTKITRNLKELVKLAEQHPYFRVVVLTNVNKGNYHEIDPLARILWDEVGVQHAYDLVRGASFSAWGIPEDVYQPDDPRDCGLPPREELDGIVETIRSINRREGGHFDQFVEQLQIQTDLYLGKPTPFKCLSAGRTIGVIYSDGSVAACEFTTPFAHLRDYDYDLGRLWASPEAEARRARITGCVCTHTCFVLTSLQEMQERKAAAAAV